MKLMPDSVRIHASPVGKDGAGGAPKTSRGSDQAAAMDFLAHLRDRNERPSQTIPVPPAALVPTVPSELALGAGPSTARTDRARPALESAHLPTRPSSRHDRPAPVEESSSTSWSAAGGSMRVDLLAARPSAEGLMPGLADSMDLVGAPPSAEGLMRGLSDSVDPFAAPLSAVGLMRGRPDHGSTDEVRLTPVVSASRPLKTMEATRIASVASESRGSPTPVSAASIEWPWLAIATGGLSYRPLPNAFALGDAGRLDTVATVQAGGWSSRASLAAPVIEYASGVESRSPFLVPNAGGLGVAVAVSEAADVPNANEVNTAVWPLPAELRELLERRRLRLVEDGQGGLHLFARDFAMDEVQAGQWAASLRQACQTMNQPLRALWINGRPYEIAQGELHDR